MVKYDTATLEKFVEQWFQTPNVCETARAMNTPRKVVGNFYRMCVKHNVKLPKPTSTGKYDWERLRRLADVNQNLTHGHPKI